MIYIYNDTGTSELGVASLKLAVPQYLQRNVATINAEQLIRNGLSDATALIIPGGADLPYCAKLNGTGNQIIRDFVAKGGIYLGICAGAYYACNYVDFIGEDYQVRGERELGFFQGTAKGSLPDLVHGKWFDETSYSKAMIPLAFEDRSPSTLFYYHGGSTFIPKTDNQDVQVIARYPDQKPAIITGQFGKGQYILSGVHFELQPVTYQKYVLDKINDPEVFSQEMRIYQQIPPQYGSQIWQHLRAFIKMGSK